jgi:hypothetical protein
MWAAWAAKMWYQWKVGNGRKTKFWEDHWFGHCSLAILYWDLNEQNISIAEVWDGRNLKLTFRRCVDQQLMQRRYDLKSIAEYVQLDETKDSLIWKFESKGVYSVSSIYAIVNFRGVMPVHISSVWKLKIPPRVHVFLWLLFYNKLLTKDNLHKRQEVPELCCVFCLEEENIPHLFFECVVARELWKKISMLTRIREQVNLLAISGLWICEKTYIIPSIVHADVLWSLWKCRNEVSFNRKSWSCMQVIYLRVAYTLARWKLLCPEGSRNALEEVILALEQLARQPPC